VPVTKRVRKTLA